jgi:hypothetical protein
MGARLAPIISVVIMMRDVRPIPCRESSRTSSSVDLATISRPANMSVHLLEGRLDQLE